MRDFPIFTTEYGVSSLILKEIPYQKAAFICIRDVQEEFFREHLEECVGFCRMAGAERIFAAGHELLAEYPLYTKVLKMRSRTQSDPEKVANLFPVTEETVSQWRRLYNEAMSQVDNASTLESRDEQRILKSSGTYFIHEAGQLLGIGWLEGNTLLAIAATQRGAGEKVLHTLMSLIDGEEITLEVASTNTRAIHFYDRMGFVLTEEVSAWYRVG